MTLIGGTVYGNTARASCLEEYCAAYGGGIANAIVATLTITNSTLSANVASSSCSGYRRNCHSLGGGISNGGTLIINSSTLSGNAAAGGSSPFPGGGAIEEDGGSSKATLQNSIVADSPSGGELLWPQHNL